MPSGTFSTPEGEAHDPQDRKDHCDDPEQVNRESQAEEQKYEKQCKQ
jgi:hypothetical protein